MSTQKGTLINKYTPDYVIFDLETTGISPNYDTGFYGVPQAE